MHHFEFALRDFMNIERFADWSTVIIFDDMLPRNVAEASRGGNPVAWAGDVFKMIPVLRAYRPDLTLLPVDTSPTGMLVVLGADPTSEALKTHYDEIIEAWVTPDPQDVPAEILKRKDAVSPETVTAAAFWPDLVRARNRRTKRASGYERLRAQVEAIGR